MSVTLLAIDTSTAVMAVAVSGARGTCTLNLPGGAAASLQLLPAIERALREAGVAWAQLQAIAFGRGPGAFTGLRTSAAVAQGLAFGLGRPVLPIDSLLVVAEDARAAAEPPGRAPAGPSGRIAVAMDARMDEIYGAVYRYEPRSPRRGGTLQEEAGPVRWHTDRAGALYTLAAWNAVLQAEATSLRAVAGSALAAFGPRLAPCPAVAAVPEEFNRAGALLRLATWAHDDGEAVDAALALPVYLRDKVALTTAEREAAAGASGAAGAAGGAVGSPTRVPASARARVQEGR